MANKPRKIVSPDVIAAFAREFVEYRLGGCASGFYDGFKVRVTMVARTHGRSWGELWPEIHKAAYELIDADPRVTPVQHAASVGDHARSSFEPS